VLSGRLLSSPTFLIITFLLENIHKRRLQLELVVQSGHLRWGGGSLDADARTFWYKKLHIFRNLWCVRTDKGS